MGPKKLLFMEKSKGRFSLLQNADLSTKDSETLDDVSEVEAEDVPSWPTTRREKRINRWLFFTLLAVIAAVAFGGVLAWRNTKGEHEDREPHEGYRMHHEHGSSLTKPERGFCGNTSEEAHANGCVLDFIPGAWVHPACYDAELEKEFLDLKPWQWFADKEAKQELTLDYIRETGGPNPIFVSMEYHRQHCAFTWKKLHRAVIRQTPIDTHIGQLKHTIHCADKLAGPDPPWKSKFFHISTSCRMPQDFELDENYEHTH
ncbi:hypothetical protein L207DRAFT_468400 [Hyaloscypha variabilis F]|uniref:Uncharacterized protein n=1 Tax=Hyaloscypha variabilis (strain UAMH 11265 / GT02V1 / F) TaxID=1149755 RepID=A0A2J6R6N1_HYAVF|nr:hypothetical protein L207DRAFT_468400 [Hyaloscypha variabilis F]